MPEEKKVFSSVGEFNREFFPKVSKKEEAKDKTPQEIGVELAKKSISKVEKNL